MNKPNDKTPEQPAAKAAVDQSVLDAITMGVALGMQQVGGQSATKGPAVRARKPPCPDCKQPNMACDGKHKQVAVYPRNPRHARFFPGVRLNGVRYISNGPGHMVTVPADANIEHAIQVFERNEDEQAQGRLAEHNSGVLGKRSSTARATRAWR